MSTTEVTASLMCSLRDGDKDAARQLVDIFYSDLRGAALFQMKNERALHTWQPTALVHELYLELLRTKGLRARDYGECERQAFLALAGQIMKRLLIHHARPLSRRLKRVPMDELPEPPESVDALYQVEDALLRLGSIDPTLRAVVEMKVFEGLTGDQIAERLCCCRRTVGNHWNFAQRWLLKEWAGAEPASS